MMGWLLTFGWRWDRSLSGSDGRIRGHVPLLVRRLSAQLPAMQGDKKVPQANGFVDGGQMGCLPGSQPYD